MTHASQYKRLNIEDSKYAEDYGEIIVEKNTIIYSNVIITHGIVIGKYSRISACSFVNKNVIENSLMGGIPAILIKKEI